VIEEYARRRAAVGRMFCMIAISGIEELEVRIKEKERFTKGIKILLLVSKAQLGRCQLDEAQANISMVRRILTNQTNADRTSKCDDDELIALELSATFIAIEDCFTALARFDNEWIHSPSRPNPYDDRFRGGEPDMAPS